MARRILVLGLAVLLIVSTLMVLGTGGSRAQSAPLAPPSAATHGGFHAPAAPHPAVNSIEVQTYQGNEVYYNQTYFSSGGYNYPGENVLFFWVYDPTADTQLNFTISDPNASRDGVSSPAFTVTVPLNTTTHEYYSYLAGVSYTFPSSLVFGGTWVVNASAPDGGSAQYNITVDTFESDLWGSPRPYTGVLPGESITAAWELYSLVNGAPATHVTNVAVDGWYYSNGSYHNLFPGGIMNVSNAPTGDLTFTVPANASADSYLDFALWPTIQSNGLLGENESAEVYWGVGTVEIQVGQETEYNGVCPTYYDNNYATGSLVQVCATVGADWNDELYGVPNLPVSIHFWNGLSIVTPGGNPPTSLTSNATGRISFNYIVTSPPLTSEYYYPYENILNLSVTDPTATSPTSDWSAWSNTSLYVDESGATGGVSVQLNQLEYYPGQTVTASWSLSSTDSAQTGALTAVEWYAYNEENDAFLSQGTISSTATSGTFTVPLPAGFVGAFGVEVEAVNATTSFYGEAYAYSTAPRLFLNPSSSTFTPGSTISITPEAYGAGSLTGATITYQVWASYDLGESYGSYGLVESGSVANNTAFTIAVPSGSAPGYYYIYAYLGSPSSGTVASAETEIDQAWGYYVTVGVNTASSYSDGSYQPGQTLTIAYQITPYGNAPLPLLYTFYVSLDGTQVYNEISSPSSSGTFQMTIPSGYPSGIVFLEVELAGTYLYGNSCDGGYCYGETALTINAHPSVLSMEVGGNSGITVGWLILLIVILVLAVLLALLIRHKKRSPPSSGGASTTTPMSPPAPAPSGTGAQEWSEPPPSQPPMPTPPPGST